MLVVECVFKKGSIAEAMPNQSSVGETNNQARYVHGTGNWVVLACSNSAQDVACKGASKS
jgi:hypothetical protein